MSEPSEKITEAINLHQEGKPEVAIPVYQEHLACHPDNAQVIYLLGTALLQMGKGKESIDYLIQAESKFPNIPDVPNNTGIAYQSMGDWEQAEKSFQRSININQNYGQAYFNYGSLLYENNRLEEAEINLRQAVRLHPGDCEVKGKLADVLKDQNKFKEAIECYKSMSKLPQVSLNSLVNYAYVLVQQNRLDAAIDVYAQILTKKPDYYQVFNSLGYLLERQGKLKDAMSLVEKSLELCPEYAEGWNNKGVIFQSLYQFDHAIESFEKSLEFKPDFPLSKFNLGTTYLLQEEYQKGWEGFSHHVQLNVADTTQDDFPVWSGAAIPRKKLLLYVDQGYGDAIMFIRFLDEIKTKSEAKVTVECPENLIKLFQNSFPSADFIVENQRSEKYDYQLPLSHCPVVLNLEIEELSLKSGYLKCSDDASETLKEMLVNNLGEKKRIGLCWQGNPEQLRDHVRSCPLLLLEPLLDHSSVQFFSFQVDDVSRALLKESGLDSKVIDLGEELNSFDQTSFALSQMDLMITVDTSLAHLAGAMQIPTWTMLCHLPDWRWHLQRSDSPWYPGMKLYRQPQWGDWNSLIINLKEAFDSKFN